MDMQISSGVFRSNGTTFSTKFKRRLFDACGGRCQYCGDTLPGVLSMHVDHVVARSKGGADTEDNLRASCKSCNSAKRDGDLQRLRDALRVRFSPLAGIVSPKQVRELEALGAVLPIEKSFTFLFERGDA
jgi:5-methylcytosine-specific restriction endonuclease McrA